MDTFLFSFFTVAYIVLFVLGLLLFRTYHIQSILLLLPVMVGLIYDNGIIAIGRYIGAGTLLEGLNLARFWIHALFTPMLVLYAWKTLEQGEVLWAKQSLGRISAFLLTVSLVLIELFTEVFGLNLVASVEYGVLSYSSNEISNGPPIMVLGVSLVLFVASIIIWRKQKWPWFFVGSLLMIIGSAVGLPIESGAVINFFELALISSLLCTAYFQNKRGTRKTG
ncbi:hypothetical protein [Gracilibacillus suaedae]|uniref:hypothetical protein n=1 Tax=Gracilibacillus suaedae TaxID=2820273 RepID=UPI001ABDB110|nr:hypothetical protein [Gracilibacillus suaedae]